MPAASYVGDTSFRELSRSEVVNKRSQDQLTYVIKGDLDDLAAETAIWTRGKVGTTIGYSNMYLQSKRTDTGNGSAFATITLNFEGYLSSTLSNPISIDDTYTLQSTTLVSDELDDDGNPQNVQCQYYGQQTTTRWMSYGATAPTTPAYEGTVPGSIPTNTLFGHFPASYTGTLEKEYAQRLAQFDRSEIADGVWAVSETWVIRIEPDSS